MRRKVTHIAIVAVMAAVVLQGVGAGFAASQVRSDAPTSGADEVYVQGDGDAVLVYDSPGSADAPNRTEYGVDVSENIAYMLVTDDVQGTPKVNGSFSAAANRTAIWANGNLSMPKSSSLEAFTLDASGVTNTETSRSDISVSATLANQSTMTAILNSVRTNGTVRVSANRLQASGNLDVDTRMGLPGSSSQSYSYSIEETSSGYTISVDTSTLVYSEYNTPENRSQLEQTLERQVQLITGQLGGSANVEVESFSRSTEGQQVRVEQDYTIELQGVEDGIGQLVRLALSRNQQVSSEQVNKLANSLKDVQINRLAVDYQIGQSGASGSFTVDVQNYSSLALAAVDVMESVNGQSASTVDADRIRKQIEAMRASDYEQQVTWSGSLTPEGSSITGQFEAHASTTNRAAYVDELQSRDVPQLESRFSLSGNVAGDRLKFAGNGSISGDLLYAELTRGFPSAGTMPSETATMMNSLRESRPQKAKLVATYGEDGVRLETGAAFGNLSALRDAIAQQSELPSVTSVVGRMDQGEGQTVVRVSNAVSGDASKSDVRSLASVSGETKIYMPGEGERDFASMDVERAEAFLNSENANSSSGPGFGPIAALVAVVGAALILARRD